jgi:predicted transposase YdaD
MKVQVRLNAISSYQSQQSSPAIQDITVSVYTRHHRLRLYETSPSQSIRDITVSVYTRHHHLRLYETSPSPTIQDISVSSHTRHLRHRAYNTHLRLRPIYAILPLVLYTVEQETNERTKQSDSYSSLLENPTRVSRETVLL